MSTLKITVLAAVILVIVLIAVVIIVKKRSPQNQASGGSKKTSGSAAASWKSYLKLQGLVLCGFLFLGAFLGWISAFFGPVKGQITSGGKLVEYRNLDLSQHPVYEDIDTENYSSIMIVTKTTVPEKGEATLVIYGDGGTSGKGEIRRLNSVANSWSRWEQANPSKHVSISIRGSEQSGVIPATQADIIVYLMPR
ncbi:MAG TPA: hypothetical protein VH724_20005 [Candidatus Angelobacter sp.]|nr:hypothetical protein [Candidatus Angelobacter sp.]